MKDIKWLTGICTYLLIFNVIPAKISAQEIQSRLEKSNTFKSDVLKRDVKYAAYTPQNYDTAHTEYPVIFLLNGYGGNEKMWQRDFSIKEKLDSLISNYFLYPCIAVMPDGMNSYYINDYQDKIRYEDFLNHEFIPYIDSVFHVTKDKRYRAVAGISMGGFGAVIHSVKYPDTYGTCIALGAAIRTDSMVMNAKPGQYEQLLSPLFGQLEPQNRITDYWKKNNPLYMIDSVNAPVLARSNWYIDCGMFDYLYDGNKAFHELLIKYRIPHEYHMRIGEHNGKYWQISFIPGLLFWNNQLRRYTLEDAQQKNIANEVIENSH